jgi:hypothetical protein
MFFVIKKEVYSLSVPYTPVIVITNSNRIKEEDEINDKFKELYKNNKDFIEISNILSTEEKELLNESYNSKNKDKLYQEVREKYKNEIIIEKERLSKEYEKAIKEEEILKNGSFSEKINVIFFGDLKYYTYGAIFLILIFIIVKITK